MELEPGATLGRYRLESVIGRGGMGVVWRATDTTLGRAVALKFLPADFARDAERIARFDREARVLAALNHPGIDAMRLDFGIATEDAGPVSLRIFDIAGRLVRTLVEEPLPAGPHRATWDRTNDRGERVAGGVYFSQLRTPDRTLRQKVVVVR